MNNNIFSFIMSMGYIKNEYKSFNKIFWQVNLSTIINYTAFKINFRHNNSINQKLKNEKLIPVFNKNKKYSLNK